MVPAYLYRHFDKDGKLLYIGSTSQSVAHRSREHRIYAKWFKEIARVDVEKLDTVEAARSAERMAIERERPAHNIETRRNISGKPDARRKRKERDRMRKRGYVLRQCWVHPEDWKQVKSFVGRVYRKRIEQTKLGDCNEEITEGDIDRRAIVKRRRPG